VKWFRYILLWIVCSSNLASWAQTEEIKPPLIELSGYIKYLQNTYFIQSIDSNASGNLIHNRLNFKFNIASKWMGRLEIRNRIFYGEQVKLTSDFADNIDQYDGMLDLSYLWVDEKSLVAQSLVDRMLLQYSDAKWTITLGRQRINWGINNVWNPNDIFNAYNFLDFDYEERPGSDAIRIQRSINDNSGIEVAYKPSKEKEKHTVALLYKWNKLCDWRRLGWPY
jgi:hypothetical protein